MNLVFGVKRQLEFVAVVKVNVGEGPFFAILDDPLVLDIVLETKLVERVGHEGQAIAEDVEIDVRALAHVPGSHAADQSGPESRQQPHQPQRVQPHIAQSLQPLWPLVNAGHRLDLVADVLVAG